MQDISVETKKETILKLARELSKALNDLNTNHQEDFSALDKEVYTANDLRLEDLDALLCAVVETF
jgi:hypothetical protein